MWVMGLAAVIFLAKQGQQRAQKVWIWISLQGVKDQCLIPTDCAGKQGHRLFTKLSTQKVK